jgi:hypothetical protein
MLMRVTVVSGSVVLGFHRLWMFNEVPLVPTASQNLPGYVKAQDTVEKSHDLNSSSI